jgi:hypothetical protein
MRSKFPALGVTVRDGFVFHGTKSLPVAGAEAVVTEGNRVHQFGAGAVAGVVSPLAGAVTALTKTSKASAIIVFPNGETWEHKLSGHREVRDAQAEAVKFSALARVADLPADPKSRLHGQPPVEGRSVLRQPTAAQAIKMWRAKRSRAEER